MEGLLSGLNPAQRDAVTCEANVLQVLAPPGSGKTKTLTARVSYLVNQCGLKPWNIIVCTFTVKAAREMKERLKDLMGDGLEKKLVLGTFHSISRRYLVTYGQHIGIDKNFGIADTTDTKAMIKRIIKANDLSIDPSRALSRISSQKAKSVSSDQFAASCNKTNTDEQECSIVYSEYEAMLKTSNLLDYDDLLLRCAQLLREHSQCVSNVEAVLIDEFQDTNEVQFSLMTLFSHRRKTITIVGDPDQSIYGWRNAESANLQKMKSLYPDTLVIFLEENYRSSGAILYSAQEVIEQDTTRPNKRIQATHAHGEQPVFRKLPTADAEARWLVTEIRRLQALTGDMLQHKDFAVLLRSAALSRHIETSLGNAGIPYRMVGGTKFYDRVEIKLILDYLRVVSQPDYNDALLRIINTPTRSLGDVAVKSLMDEANRKQASLWKIVLDGAQGNGSRTLKLSSQAERGLTEIVKLILTCQKKIASGSDRSFSPYDLVEHLLKRLDFEAFLKRKYADDHQTRWANVEELKAQVADLTAAMDRGEDLLVEEVLPEIAGLNQRTMSQEVDALRVFLANVTLASDVQKQSDATAQEEQQFVTISTIHAAKGLEWPVVFIPACYEGSIPHSRAEDTDEERRLLYVGMTRAQAMLYLSCPVKNSSAQETTTSSFLTHKGVEALFSPQGPDLQYYAVGQLAQTLRRDVPAFHVVEQGRGTLELASDSYWPADGTMPIEEKSRWDLGRESGYGMIAGSGLKRGRERDQDALVLAKLTGFTAASNITMQDETKFSSASATLKGSFTSASSIRARQAEDTSEDLTLAKMDRRAEEGKTGIGRGKKGQKIATGASSIASYFGGSVAAVPTPATRLTSLAKPASATSRPLKASEAHKATLRDITNAAPQSAPVYSDLPSFDPAAMSHRLRTAPSAITKRTTLPTERSDYVFLSSSPPHEAIKPAKRTRSEDTENDETLADVQIPAIRPASTFHVTSMAQAGMTAAPAKRTLGMGRAFKPWSSRGGTR